LTDVTDALIVKDNRVKDSH